MMPEDGTPPAAALEENGKMNPCSSIGCNSYNCAWASGGAVRKIEKGKSCRNAKILGNNLGAAASAQTSLLKTSGDPSTAATSELLTIQTLRDCMHAVRDKTGGDCSGHFQLHKDTYECSCVPANAKCEETE